MRLYILVMCFSVVVTVRGFDIDFGELHLNTLREQIEKIGYTYSGQEQADKLGAFIRETPGAQKVGTPQQGTLLHLVAQPPFSVASLKGVFATYPDIDVNRNDIVGTPLHYAATDSVDKVLLVLSGGADVSARTRLTGKIGTHETPLDRAISAHKLQIVKVLIQKGSPVDKNTYALAASSGNVEIFQQIKGAFKGGATESQKIEALRQALKEARRLRDFRFKGTDEKMKATTSIIKTLLQSINAENIPADIILLASGTTTSILNDLWDTNVNFLVTGEDGTNPLHVAAREGASPQVVKYLLKTGIARTAQDDAGKTPSSYAQAYKQETEDLLNNLTARVKKPNSFIQQDYIKQVREKLNQMESVIQELQ